MGSLPRRISSPRSEIVEPAAGSACRLPASLPARQSPRRVISILGIPVDVLTLAETLDRVDAMIDLSRAGGDGHQIATVNVDFIVKAIQDPELRFLLQEVDMALADGMPVVWGARLLGMPAGERVAGADLVPLLAERAAQKGYSMYFLGAAPGVASRAAEILQAQHPNLKIAGVCSPPFRPVLEMDPAIVEKIKHHRPDILLVAFGNPKQEKWIGLYGRELGVPVMIGVGGSLDFIAGTVRRAPKWMQQAGLEWLYRILQEPRRLWRRYVSDIFVFSAAFTRQLWALHRAKVQGSDFRINPVHWQGVEILQLQGCLTVENVAAFQQAAARALSSSSHLIMDLAGVKFLDSAAIGTLTDLANRARRAGGKLTLIHVPEPVDRLLRAMHLDLFFTIAPDGSQVFDSLRHGSERPDGWRKVQGIPKQVKSNDLSWQILRAPRRFDASTAPIVASHCGALLADNPFLILDLTETAFLASAGLAALSRLTRAAREKNGCFRTAGYRGEVRKVIDLARFDRVLHLYPDVPSALSAPYDPE